MTNIPTEINLLIPVVLITLNQGLKQYFGMPSKWAIAINWLGGIVLNVVFLYPFTSPQTALLAVLTGFLLGSSAGGLYDGAKPITQTIRNAIK